MTYCEKERKKGKWKDWRENKGRKRRRKRSERSRYIYIYIHIYILIEIEKRRRCRKIIKGEGGGIELVGGEGKWDIS